MSEHKATSPKASVSSLTPPTTAKAPAEPKQKKEAKQASTEPKVPRESALRRRYPENALVEITTPEGKNPKREGTKANTRFELYRGFITVTVPQTSGPATPAASAQ